MQVYSSAPVLPSQDYRDDLLLPIRSDFMTNESEFPFEPSAAEYVPSVHS